MVHISHTDEVKNRINAGLDKLFHVDNGVAVPNVCLICDRFTGPDWSLVAVDELKKKQHFFKVDDTIEKLDENLKGCYQYTGRGWSSWMNHCLFSKRGICITKNRNNSFVVCNDCCKCLKSKKRPTKAIANGYVFGLHQKN